MRLPSNETKLRDYPSSHKLFNNKLKAWIQLTFKRFSKKLMICVDADQASSCKSVRLHPLANTRKKPLGQKDLSKLNKLTNQNCSSRKNRSQSCLTIFSTILRWNTLERCEKKLMHYTTRNLTSRNAIKMDQPFGKNFLSMQKIIRIASGTTLKK